MSTSTETKDKPDMLRIHSRGLSSKQVINIPKHDFNAKLKLKGAIKAVMAKNRLQKCLKHSDEENSHSENSEIMIMHPKEDPTYPEKYQAFLNDFPDYASQATDLDALRAHDFARLDEQGHIYVDYTGGCLYPASLVTAHSELLLHSVLGNPHSTNPTSLAATELVEHARHAVLRHVNADPEEYTAVFTLNATGALKLVAEAFPFTSESKLLLSVDNHNSVGGIREHALRKGASVYFAPLESTLRHNEAEWSRLIEMLPDADGTKSSGMNLFAYPAQSNFSGVKHPLSWVKRAKERGWTVLLDTAAYLPTNKLDLSEVPADFVTISFYKIFGYPTGVGALVAKKSSLEILRRNRPWYCGGVVTMATVNPPLHVLAPYEAAFEEGTVAFTSIPAVMTGLQYMWGHGVEKIERRVHALTAYFLREVVKVKHSNGSAFVTILGPSDAENHGGTVALAFWDDEGRFIFPSKIEHEANQRNISLRIGCFCNPGAGETAFGAADPSRSTALLQTYKAFGVAGDMDHLQRDASTGAYSSNPTSPVSNSARTSSKSMAGDKSPVSSVWRPLSWFSLCVPAVGSGGTTQDTSVLDPSNVAVVEKDYLSSTDPLPRNDFLALAMQKLKEESGGKEHPIAALRVSFGIATNFADVFALLQFIETLAKQTL